MHREEVSPYTHLMAEGAETLEVQLHGDLHNKKRQGTMDQSPRGRWRGVKERCATITSSFGALYRT